jgi:raffinose/stachyose/melibiose transport system substrate-binding protein
VTSVHHFRHRGAVNTTAIGLILLAITIVVSLVVVIRNVISIERPDKVTIRIAHWQLEAGYREALDAIIKDFEALHDNKVKVVQMPVTEKVYAQWINTQMISGTAPDIVEVGQSNVLLKDENTVRYFVPLGDEVTKPNPHNKDTDLEGLPWKETFIDGMRGGYRDNLQDYYMVPTTMIGMRLFVNTTLLDKVGAKVPTTYAELIDVSQKIRAYSYKERGGAVVPIVSCYQLPSIINPYLVPFMASLEPTLDQDLDGTVTPLEGYRGMVKQDITFETPQIKQYFEAMKLLCDQMQKGFAAMDRQSAQFLFVNGNAGFLWTGSWDARGTFLAAEKRGIKIALIQPPLPAKGERFGDVIAGRQNEAAGRGQGPYGIYKGTKHYNLALSFLQFVTSKKANQKFNEMAEWPPVVLGSKPAEIMKPFMPDPVGYTSHVNFAVGSKLGSEYNVAMTAYMQGEKDYKWMTETYLAAMKNDKIGGDWASWFEYDKLWRDCRNQERLLARDSLEALMDPAGQTDIDKARYARTLLQQTRRNNGREAEHRFELYRKMELKKF